MIPSSEVFEDFFDRLGIVDKQLAKLKNTEVKREDILDSLSSLAKEWLKLSEAIRNVEGITESTVDFFDRQMREVLRSTSQRTRASTFRNELQPLSSDFLNRIIVPIIKFEGSPSQVASRQLVEVFDGKITNEEAQYIEEAARCLSSRCYRASIIMIWASAMARFHSAIERMGFAAYNVAFDQSILKRGSPYSRMSRSGNITSLPELQRSRDFDILVAGMELWRYDLTVFEQLERLLGTRNGAAHPGMLNPNATDVLHFAQNVSSYVFSLVAL